MIDDGIASGVDTDWTPPGLTSSVERPAIASLAKRLCNGSVVVLAEVPDATHAMAFARAIEHRYGTVVRTSTGGTGSDIVRFLRENAAALIATDLPHSRELIGPLLRSAMGVRLLRYVHVPVVAVAPDLCGLPRGVVVGIDFTRASVRAARAALDLVARPVSRGSALLRLVHVERPTRHDRRLTKQANDDRQTALARLIAQLDAPAYVRVDATVRVGSVAGELVQFADESDADFVALGATRRPRGRCLTDGIVADLFRDGRRSLLVVPTPY